MKEKCEGVIQNRLLSVDTEGGERDSFCRTENFPSYVSYGHQGQIMLLVRESSSGSATFLGKKSYFRDSLTQQTFICSKSTIKTPERRQ